MTVGLKPVVLPEGVGMYSGLPTPRLSAARTRCHWPALQLSKAGRLNACGSLLYASIGEEMIDPPPLLP